MIHKHKGEFVCTCSECGHEEYGGVLEDFRVFVQQLRDCGWRIRKVEDEWQHTCPGCWEE